MSKVNWNGVYPAVTTQFKPSFKVDLEATAKVIEGLLRDGVSGLILCGTVGENCSLTLKEKRAILEMAVSVVKNKVPVLMGVAEYTSAFAIETAKMAQKCGVDGIMLMPTLLYSATPFETVHHFRSVAKKSDLPIMVYNNPPVYKTDVTPDMLAQVADCETIVCFKESSGDTRRFIDLKNKVGDRFIPFCGLDDVVVESVMMGAVGWVSGMSNAFPIEGNRLFNMARAGHYKELQPLYEWFMPLLHLDARPDLVQCIKLCEYLAGRGTYLTRPPRLPLKGKVRQEVVDIYETAVKNRV